LLSLWSAQQQQQQLQPHEDVCAMSRSAAAGQEKKNQKAAIAAKNDEKDRQSALGMTPGIKKMIGTDVVLCMECGATQMGPTKCECKGGRKKPGDHDEPIPHLISAAKARANEVKADDLKASAKDQAQVQKERLNRKEKGKEVDLNAEYQGDGVDILQIVEFPAGKLGMDIEGNAICKVGDPPSNAAELGVKVGWVVYSVNGTVVTPNKAAIVKEVAGCMKIGPVKFGFRVPIMSGYHHCAGCGKFLETDEFDGTQLSGKGAGKQLCMGCEEFAGMGDF